ncbi:hypothetical protein ACMHYK_15460 [Candidatus Enterenecus avicola]
MENTYKTSDFLKAMYQHKDSNSNGVIFLGTLRESKKDGKTSEYMDLKPFPVHQVDNIDSFSGDYVVNRFFTPNSFSVKNDIKKTNTNILGLYSLFLDLDYSKMGLKKEYVLQELADRLAFSPSAVVDSGNGLHVYFFIRHINLFNKSVKANNLLKAYKSTMRGLSEAFQNLGADTNAISLSNFLRLPNTLNVKPSNGNYGGIKEVKILELNKENIYSFEEISKVYNSKYLTEKANKPEKTTKKTHKGFVKKLSDLSLGSDRADDLIKIVKMRKGIVDSRHLFLRLCIYFDTSKVQKLNNAFENPKSKKEVDSMVDYHYNRVDYLDDTDKKEYLKMTKWRNEALIRNLNITAKEQKKLKTIISKEEARQRKNKRRAPKKQVNKVTKEVMIRYVHLASITQTNAQITKALKISETTLKTYKKTEIDLITLNKQLKKIIAKTTSTTSENRAIKALVKNNNVVNMNLKQLKTVIKLLEKTA